MTTETSTNVVFDENLTDDELLVRVVDHYHVAAAESPEVERYLDARALRHPELLQHFKLGWSNRTLGFHLPKREHAAGKRMRARLQRLGVLRDSGHEHFHGCITVPGFDAEGRIVEMYGRRIGEGPRPRALLHVYLHQDEPRGEFNLGGIEPDKPVVFCGSVIDALTFWCAGITNVTACFGAERFNSDSTAAFKTRNVTEVYIAFRNDEAGNTAAEKVSLALDTIGIATYRVELTVAADVNDVAVGARDPVDVLNGLVRHPVRMRGNRIVVVPAPVEPAEVTTPPTATPSSDEQVFTFGDRRWRIRGISKNTTPGSMKVNVMVARGDFFHVDSLDLYAARHRARFVEQAAEVAVDERVIKSDIGKVLLAIEAMQDEQMKRLLEPAEKPIEVVGAEREEALALLRDPHLLDRIVTDFDRCGTVNEKTNKLVAYLAATSRLLDDPLAILIQSSSAAGKTSLMDAVLSFIPPEHRVTYSAMTGQSLFYLGASSVKHKVLAIAEEQGAARAAYALKLLQSEGTLTIASTGKEANTGRIVTESYTVEGPVALFLTTTSASVDEELLNRCLVLAIDEDREHTRAIHDLQRRSQSLEGVLARGERDRLVRLHQNAQRLLRPLVIVNPFWKELSFPDHRTRTRRDHPKYLGLIRAVTLLHQHQREVQTVERDGAKVEYIEVTKDDLAVANRLAREVLGRSLDELPPQTRRVLDQIDAYVVERMKAEDIERSAVRFTRQELRDRLHLGDTQLKLHLRRLVDLELVLRHRLPLDGGGHVVTYELLYKGGADDGVLALDALQP